MNESKPILNYCPLVVHEKVVACSCEARESVAKIGNLEDKRKRYVNAAKILKSMGKEEFEDFIGQNPTIRKDNLVMNQYFIDAILKCENTNGIQKLINSLKFKYQI